MTRNVLWSRASVCLSAAACLRYCTDPDVTWGTGRGCPLVAHYWADLQSVLGLPCYGNITRNVSVYMLVLALGLVKTSGQCNLTERLHRRHTWTVQWYSPDGSSVHPT